MVDKGAGQMWGFCKQWVWDQVAAFLTEGGHKKVPGSAKDFVATVSALVEKLCCSRNKQAKLCRLYIIGKAHGKQKACGLEKAGSGAPSLPAQVQ
jgi:hypothetical protein|mmetsp:Transcript_15964/g.27929  ORF Transcript_15964/g.27929 Transcript_15964/m.27929 type:complete len:95 (-) Transcript_15964:120-404(-)